MKKILIITLLIIATVGTIFYFRQKNAQESGTTNSGFKSFFNFGTKKPSSSTGTNDELSSDFTTPEEKPGDETKDEGTTPTTSVFGTTPPITPGGTLSEKQGETSGGLAQGGTPTNGTPFEGGVGTGTGGTPSPRVICSADDLEIDFTPEEIARLQVLERRFYDLAPVLRTDEDVQTEAGNYSSYKTLNDKNRELISYCEATTPQLGTALNKRVPTPLYTDPAQNQEYFTDDALPQGPINMTTPGAHPRFIEKLFRLNIW